MASKDRSKSPNPSSSPTLSSSGKVKKGSPAGNRKVDVPASFTIDVNQITSAKNKLKNVGKGTPEGSTEQQQHQSTITIESPEKQGPLRILSSGSWEQKWCVLKEGKLYIFPNAKAPVPETILSLNGSKIGASKQAGVEHCFHINTTTEALVFCADDDYEYITWIVALRGATLYLKITNLVVESPKPTTTSPKQPSSLQTSSSAPSVPTSSPNGSPHIPRIETTPSPASPALGKRSVPSVVTSKNPNFAFPPPASPSEAKRNSADIGKLPSRLQALDISATPSSPSSSSSPSSPCLSSVGSPSSSSDKFSSYRRSADISKLAKENFVPLSDAISAAYRKSVDVSKLSHSATLLSPTASPPNLFSSAEIIPSDREDEKGGKRGLLGVPGGMFSKWKQRWVVLAHDTLSVFKHEEDEDKKDPVHSLELIFCQPKVVKSEKGKYVFEIHAPGRTIQFGAPSSVDLLEWIHTIQETQTTLMQSYLQYNLGGKGKEDGEEDEDKEELELELERSKKKLSTIMQSNGNNTCADCGAAEPIWASINWGVFICIECSGVHRQMGSHISKVRSVTMDKWDNDVLEFMENHGNNRVNAELEHTITPNFTKITPTSSRQDREAFIKAKYEEKLFYKKSEQPEQAAQ